MLDYAVKFYFQGFQNIFSSIFPDQSAASTAEQEKNSPSLFSSFDEFMKLAGVVLKESLIALLFWYALLLLIRHL